MTNDAFVEPHQQAGVAPSTATLFTAAGKIVTTLGRIDRASATLDLGEGWTSGSIAILTRNGMRLFGTLLLDGDGTARFAFDDPLHDWQRDHLIGDPAARRPIVIRERLAA